jgi:hypothetical protein
LDQYVLLGAVAIGLAWTAGFVVGKYALIPVECVGAVLGWELVGGQAGLPWALLAGIVAATTAAGVFARSALRHARSVDASRAKSGE